MLQKTVWKPFECVSEIENYFLPQTQKGYIGFIAVSNRKRRQKKLNAFKNDECYVLIVTP